VLAGILVLALIVVARLLFGAEGSASRASSGRNCRTIVVAASPDKADLLRQLATRYAETKPKVDGHCVEVTVTAKDSGAAMTALGRGWNEAVDGPRPDVWAPSARSWVQLLRGRQAANHVASIVPDDLPSVATSPLVVAMPQPMAGALRWPANQLGWGDLLAAARNPAGWAKYGHPDWGPFRVGATNPYVSTAGLNTLIASYYIAASQVTRQPTLLTRQLVADRRVRTLVLGIDRSIAQYGESAPSFLAGLQRADEQGQALRYVSAVPVEEKSVWDYNQGNPSGDPRTAGRHGRPKVPLVAIYPKEGTLVSDHPYVVLRAPWVDDTRRQVAAGFLGFLQRDTSQAVFQQAGFRDFNGRPGPQATQGNGALSGQLPRILPPPEPEVLGRVIESWSQIRKRGNVLAVIDVSGSMRAIVPGTGLTRLDLAKQAAMSSLGLFANDDLLGLWAFSSDLDAGRDYLEIVPVGPIGAPLDGGSRRAVLRARLASLTATHGHTGLYDTTLAAYMYLKANYRPDRINAVVLLTDGRNDKAGGLTLDALVQQLQRSQENQPLRVVTIGYGDADVNALRKISAATGGRSYFAADPAAIRKIFIQAITNF
jgi:Ca-activated chloride channel family protein